MHRSFYPTVTDGQKARIGRGWAQLLVLENAQEVLLAELGTGEDQIEVADADRLAHGFAEHLNLV